MARGQEKHTPSADAFEPEKKNVKEIRLLWIFLSKYRLTIFLAFVALVVAAGATLAIPQAVRRIIDLGFSSDNLALIDVYFLALLGVAFVLAFATFSRYYLVTWLGERVVADIRKAVFNRVISLGPTFFEQNRSGDIVSRLTTDTTVIQSVVGSSASVALRNILTLLGGLGFMLYTSLKLMSVVLIAVPLVVVPIIFLGRKVKRLSKQSQDRIAEASAIANETVGAVQTVQSYTREAYERRRFADYVENAFSTAVKRINVRAWMTAVVILLVFGAVDLILWVGASDVATGKMTGGELTAFLIYAVLVAGAVGSLSEVYGELQRAAGAASRCLELIAMEPEVKVPENPIPLPRPVKGLIEFREVSFAYPSRPGEKILDGFSLTVREGETVAIVGPSGAGKSTVFQLLQRFYDPTSGQVLIDGVPLEQADPSDIRAQMSVVHQESVIFAATVEENIRYGNTEATDEMLQNAAEAAQANEFITRLPEGMKTWLGERGTRLSGGQKQRIAIARAILRDAPILLLDEATSALDAESEKLVQAALDKLMQGRTTLVIAHRLATVLQADRIVVMDRGKIVDIGSHQELLQKGGLYARLAELQFTDGNNGT
ncbi:ABC transporter transmembrane domain-containing protein [Luteithermobacter gelatinilyticus]|uniref:ABC transporter transmembrane domain-containing protein n=1 Tax=Luteithermobacter gelatinilyticus TaxID=2582913 RepID=UPI0011065939|nr:ABC transporter transmembrane domain-containing protein [Luteithermobacter gelatinilyticus]